MSDFLVLGFVDEIAPSTLRYDIIEIFPAPFNQETYDLLLRYSESEWTAEEIEEYRTCSDFDRATLIISKNYPEAVTVDVHTDVAINRFMVKFWDHEIRNIRTQVVDDRYERIVDGRVANVADDIVYGRFEIFGDMVFWVKNETGEMVWDNEEKAKTFVLEMMGD